MPVEYNIAVVASAVRFDAKNPYRLYVTKDTISRAIADAGISLDQINVIGITGLHLNTPIERTRDLLEVSPSVIIIIGDRPLEATKRNLKKEDYPFGLSITLQGEMVHVQVVKKSNYLIFD